MGLSKANLKKFSIGANYRWPSGANSTADFIYKLKIVEDEVDETIQRLDLLVNAGLTKAEHAKKLLSEIAEVLSIVVASVKTTRERNNTRKS
jgi:four helix bundle protein